MNLLTWLSNLVEGAVLRGFHSALKKLGIDPAQEPAADPLAAAFERRLLAEAPPPATTADATELADKTEKTERARRGSRAQ